MPPRLYPHQHFRRFATVALHSWILALLPLSADAQTRFSFETRGFLSVRPIVFSPDSRLLALAANGADILLFDLDAQANLAVLKHVEGVKTPVSVGRIDFAPDGRTLAAAFTGDERDRELVFFDIKKRTRRDSIALGGDICTDFAFSPDGTRFAARIANSASRIK